MVEPSFSTLVLARHHRRRQNVVVVQRKWGVGCAWLVGSVTPFAELVCRTAFSFHEGASQPEEMIEQAASLAPFHRYHRSEMAYMDFLGPTKPPKSMVFESSQAHCSPSKTALVWHCLRKIWADGHNYLGSSQKPEEDMKKGWAVPFQSLLERASGMDAILLGTWPEERVHQIREAFGNNVSDRPHPQPGQPRCPTMGPTCPFIGQNTCASRGHRRCFDAHPPQSTPARHSHVHSKKMHHRSGGNNPPSQCHARVLRSLQAIHRLFSNAPSAIERTIEVANRCQFSLGDLRYRYPKEIVPEGWTTMRWLTTKPTRGSNGGTQTEYQRRSLRRWIMSFHLHPKAGFSRLFFDCV